MPGLSADSLEDVSREAEATPGLQQLARVLTIQLQVLNGTDDLCMHVSNQTEHTPSVEREGEGGVRGAGGRGKKRQKEEGKEKKRKVGRDKTPLLCHLRRKHTAVVTQDKNTHSKMAGGLISRGTSCSAHP